jgi:hypothetical protein
MRESIVVHDSLRQEVADLEESLTRAHKMRNDPNTPVNMLRILRSAIVEMSRRKMELEHASIIRTQNDIES